MKKLKIVLDKIKYTCYSDKAVAGTKKTENKKVKKVLDKRKLL